MQDLIPKIKSYVVSKHRTLAIMAIQWLVPLYIPSHPLPRPNIVKVGISMYFPLEAAKGLTYVGFRVNFHLWHAVIEFHVLFTNVPAILYNFDTFA